MKCKELQNFAGQKTFAVIFDKGDEVMRGLKKVAEEQKFGGSHFTAIGAFESVTLGYFDWEKKDYRKIPINEQVEVASLVGDIAESDKGPKIHAHVVVGKSDGTAWAGHLLEAIVRPTLEVMLVESPTHLRRRHDPDSGLALIRL